MVVTSRMSHLVDAFWNNWMSMPSAKATTNRLVISRIPDKASGVRRRQKKSEYNSVVG